MPGRLRTAGQWVKCMAPVRFQRLVRQKPFLPRDSLYRSDVLCNLHYAQVFAFFVSYSEIPDEYVFVSHPDPEILMILSPFPQILHDFFNDMDAYRRMAVLHLSPDDGLRPYEYPFFPLGSPYREVFQAG